MKVLESIRIAMRALAANKLRSVLTMLGIIIGVGAVIALMSIGRGVEKFVTDQFASLGSNLLFVVPGQLDGRPFGRVDSLTLDDMRFLGDQSQIRDVRAVSAEFSTEATVARDGKDMQATASAVTPSFVDLGEPHDFSRSTLRPFGPSVTLTALVKVSTPFNIFSLAFAL